MKKVKTKLFPQSFSIDSLLVKRQLDSKGYSYSRLKDQILYRGDERGPDIIFKEGFSRKTKGEDILPASINRGISKACVATTKELVCAVGFADNPNTTQGYFAQPKKESGWVYMLYADKGIDLTCYQDAHIAHLVKEVVLTDVPPEHIIAAFQIRTTKNNIDPYVLEWLCDASPHSSWQILCTDFIKNTKISPEIDSTLYEEKLSEFLNIFTKQYFRIPWAPDEEEKDFSITYYMKDLAKKAYKMFGASIEEANKIEYTYQIEALELGFSIDEVLSDEFCRVHLQAAKKGVSVRSLRGTTAVEAYGLGKKLPYEQVKGLESTVQVDGLLLGFLRKDVLSPEFNRQHLNAVEKGVAIDHIRLELSRGCQNKKTAETDAKLKTSSSFQASRYFCDAPKSISVYAYENNATTLRPSRPAAEKRNNDFTARCVRASLRTRAYAYLGLLGFFLPQSSEETAQCVDELFKSTDNSVWKLKKLIENSPDYKHFFYQKVIEEPTIHHFTNYAPHIIGLLVQVFPEEKEHFYQVIISKRENFSKYANDEGRLEDLIGVFLEHKEEITSLYRAKEKPSPWLFSN